MNKILPELASAVLGGILFPAARYAIQQVVAKWLLKTEHDVIAYVHYRQRAAGNGHRAKHPRDCSDNDCVKITK